jgi:hypothetical protein
MELHSNPLKVFLKASPLLGEERSQGTTHCIRYSLLFVKPTTLSASVVLTPKAFIIFPAPLTVP